MATIRPSPTESKLHEEAEEALNGVMLEVAYCAIVSGLVAYLSRNGKSCKNVWVPYTVHAVMTLLTIGSVVHGCIRVARLPKNDAFRPLSQYVGICLAGILGLMLTYLAFLSDRQICKA